MTILETLNSPAGVATISGVFAIITALIVSRGRGDTPQQQTVTAGAKSRITQNIDDHSVRQTTVIQSMAPRRSDARQSNLADDPRALLLVSAVLELVVVYCAARFWPIVAVSLPIAAAVFGVISGLCLMRWPFSPLGRLMFAAALLGALMVSVWGLNNLSSPLAAFPTLADLHDDVTDARSISEGVRVLLAQLRLEGLTAYSFRFVGLLLALGALGMLTLRSIGYLLHSAWLAGRGPAWFGAVSVRLMARDFDGQQLAGIAILLTMSIAVAHPATFEWMSSQRQLLPGN